MYAQSYKVHKRHVYLYNNIQMYMYSNNCILIIKGICTKNDFNTYNKIYEKTSLFYLFNSNIMSPSLYTGTH